MSASSEPCDLRFPASPSIKWPVAYRVLAAQPFEPPLGPPQRAVADLDPLAIANRLSHWSRCRRPRRLLSCLLFSRMKKLSTRPPAITDSSGSHGFQRWFPVPVFTEIQPGSTRHVSFQFRIERQCRTPRTQSVHIRGCAAGKRVNLLHAPLGRLHCQA